MIASRYKEWELTGALEVREGNRRVIPANPSSEGAAVQHGPQPDPDNAERFLALLFPRRYVVYCARGRRFDAVQGIANLARSLTA